MDAVKGLMPKGRDKSKEEGPQSWQDMANKTKDIY